MVGAIDYDVYYRHENPATLSTTVLWNWGADRQAQSVNAEKLADFTADPNVKSAGKETNGLDLHGSPENNPFFVKESASPMDKTSDFHLKEGSPASGTGHALPEDIAKTLGVNANEAVNRGALVNIAWGGGTTPGADDKAGDNAGNGGKADNGNNGGNNGGAVDNSGNGGSQPSSTAASKGGDGSTAGGDATGSAGQGSESTNPSNSKAGAGQKNSSIAKPGANAGSGR